MGRELERPIGYGFRDFLMENPFRAMHRDMIPQSKITDCIRKTPESKPIAAQRIYVDDLFLGEDSIRSILGNCETKEDKEEVKSLADRKIKRVVIECEDGSSYEGNVTHVCGCPYDYASFKIEANVKKENAAYGIKNVIFQNPATIVYWADGTKTVVNCMDNVEAKEKIKDGKKIIVNKPRKCDSYSKEVGLAMAIAKKWAGNQGNYNNIFRKFLKMEG